MPHGFTLVELVVVMAMIALLLTLAVPRYFGALDNGRRSVQAQNIATVRDALDKFYGDNGRYPDALAELVDRRYLRTMPIDPVTDQPDWIVIAPSDAALGGTMPAGPSPRTPAAGAVDLSGKVPMFPSADVPVPSPVAAGAPR